MARRSRGCREVGRCGGGGGECQERRVSAFLQGWNLAGWLGSEDRSRRGCLVSVMTGDWTMEHSRIRWRRRAKTNGWEYPEGRRTRGLGGRGADAAGPGRRTLRQEPAPGFEGWRQKGLERRAGPGGEAGSGWLRRKKEGVTGDWGKRKQEPGPWQDHPRSSCSSNMSGRGEHFEPFAE